jgi:tetratricopeptide (TPR) repeat protein
MTENDQGVGSPTPEQRRIATQQFERAGQAVATGNFDYGIELLCTCCQLDPSNLIYRKALRTAQKNKFRNNLRGSALAFLTTIPAKWKMQSARRSGNYRKVLEHGERVLARNPWATGVQLTMAEAAEELGLPSVAAWILEQARQKNPKDLRVNRALARLHEQLGNFKQAIALWDLVAKANPNDYEAAHKGKDLAASQTIARGNYEETLARRGEGQEANVETPEAPTTAAPSASESRLTRQIEPIRAKIQHDPANPNHYLQLADLYRQAELLGQAREVLEGALGPTGQHFEIQMALAELEIEPYRQNLRLAEAKLRLDPQNDEVRRHRQRLLREINNRELAIYRQRAERFPSEMSHRLEMGIRLLKAGQADEAIQELQQGRKEPRQRWRAMLFLGYAFKSKNNWSLARRNFEDALAALPANEEASRKELLFQLAKGAAEEKDWENAFRLGNELANTDFGFRDIGRLLQVWQQQMNQASIPGED